MRAIVTLLFFSLLGLFPACTGLSGRPPLTVTYVANEGFLIEGAGKKVLIDALFGGWQSDWCDVPSDSIVQLMTGALPPFDDIDLIAVTHDHVDHFDAEITAAHLKNNHRGVLVCTPQAEEKLAATGPYAEIKDRIRTVYSPGDSAVLMEFSGIGLRILPTRHGAYWETDPVTKEYVNCHRYVQHLEFVITLGRRVLFHCGDAPLMDPSVYYSFGFGEKDMDLAFVQWWSPQEEMMSATQALVRDIIRPERIILMHLSPGEKFVDQSKQKVPVAREVFVPQYSMQSWVFP
jgi:L-ascorbate metabolism protein UlaG (beta-lactamase superfamily)